MGQKQTAFECVSCFYGACPYINEPVIIKVKHSSNLASDDCIEIDSKDREQIHRLCKDCLDFVKYL